MTSRYPDVEANPDFAALENEVLRFWAEDGTFKRSVEQRDREINGKSNAYVFYDGPPFANGLPHYGHLLTGYVKDAIARYHTMKGSRVERRFGWDCHGLPAEMASEKELGISGRAAITNFGIDKFNEHCRTSVMKYVSDWRYYVTRQGRWVDFDNDYKTMDRDFMESVLWAFSELYKKDLVYESFRVMPYSWAAETPVSNFETRIDNATREREDKAVYVKFKLKKAPFDLSTTKAFYIVAWTTTPWTLPSNLALAVNPNIEYVAIEGENEFQIIAEPSQAAYEKLTGNQGNSHALKGKDLVGLSYEPIFPFFKDQPNAFRILDGGDNVTVGDGTAVLHIAPGFGEVDQQIANSNGIETLVPVDEKGRFTAEIYDLPDLKLQGLTVVADTRVALADVKVSDDDKAQHIAEKDVSKYGLANMRIARWLKAHGHLVKDEPFKHNYPHCWRTDTPLIYRAMSSWYVNVQKIKSKMEANNKTIHWIPDHVQSGQMGKGIESAPDWSISRNRFWGTPIPIWRSPSGKLKVFGSIAELEKASGKPVKDLHRPYIDAIAITEGGETYTRVEDVFDCWFESGSMPYAQLHYPFENKELFEANFPADFITEYIAQTRGWFYTLQVLSAALFEKAPFKHCICHGVVIDEETGLKYSKRLKNYKDPKEVMDAYGADALRWMMLASPVMRGSDLAVDPDGKFIRDVVRLNIKPLWSAYNFFTLYANADGIVAKEITTSPNLLDRYILAKCKVAITQVQASLDGYDTPGATEAITTLLDVLNNWYIRRSRPRFWAEAIDFDKQFAYDTLFTVLNYIVKAAAPLLPFVSEAIYRGLNGAQNSVHLQDFPDVNYVEYDQIAVDDMDRVRDACMTAHAVRSKQNIRTRQPLAKLEFHGSNYARIEKYKDLIRDEVNVKEVTTDAGIGHIADFVLKVNFPVVGKRLPSKMKELIAASKSSQYTKNGDKLNIAGEELLPEEFSLLLQPKAKEGAQALPTQDALVVLDLTITPELEAEGMARDLVRMIQQARKDAGLHVSDRITLGIDVPAGFKAALATHKEYIAEQTLAVSLSEGSGKSDKKLTQELDGATFVIGISKAA